MYECMYVCMYEVYVCKICIMYECMNLHGQYNEEYMNKKTSGRTNIRDQAKDSLKPFSASVFTTKTCGLEDVANGWVTSCGPTV